MPDLPVIAGALAVAGVRHTAAAAAAGSPHRVHPEVA